MRTRFAASVLAVSVLAALLSTPAAATTSQDSTGAVLTWSVACPPAPACPTPPPTSPPPPAPTWAPGTTWQWQLTGALNLAYNVAVYDIDLFDNTAGAIASLKASGKRVICYFSAGSGENWRPDYGTIPAAALGNALSGWAGEKWLDTRNAQVRQVMTARMDLAVSKGCDGVEADNIDGYTNSSGFPLTATTQLDYNRFLATAAHARHLAIPLKNDLDQVAALLPSFDFLIVEECAKYNECALTAPFIAAGKAVFQAEYTGFSSSVCTAALTAHRSLIFKSLNLGPERTGCN